MNTTDAEIAEKLEGMKRGNLQLDLFEGELWLTIRNKHRGVDIFVDGNVLPSDLLAFCREVVERVGTSDPSVHQEGVNTSSDEAHGIKGGQTT